MTDAQAIEAALRGDRDAFSLLVQRYQRMVEAVAYGVTKNGALVDDVVQDTFVTAWRTLDRLRDPSCIRPWLTAITRNLARNARRRGARDTTMRDVASDHSPFEQLSEQQRDREIAAALAKLPARYREPIVLFYYEHCTVKEVADALALREQAVMQRLSRGRRRLGETLATRIEITLESRKSRAALAACVLALLPMRTASAASLGTAAMAATTTLATASTTPWWSALLARMVAYWRLAAGLVGVTAAALILLAAVERSNAIAARAKPGTAEPARDEPAHAKQPQLPDDANGDRIYRNLALADLDPKVSCARGAGGLVIMTLGKDAMRRDGDRLYYEPSPELQQTIKRVSTAAAANCGGDRWPELYVQCEGTLFDILDGNVTCYPYDVFAEPVAWDPDDDHHPIFGIPPRLP
jgi:RNA polymerase sigma factor (sigma-70 family)